MNLSIFIIFILIVAVIGAYFIFKTPSTSVTPPPKISPPTASPTVTTDEAAILSDQINSLTDEELAAISTDMTDFSTSTENDMSTDTGLFYYE